MNENKIRAALVAPNYHPTIVNITQDDADAILQYGWLSDYNPWPGLLYNPLLAVYIGEISTHIHKATGLMGLAAVMRQDEDGEITDLSDEDIERLMWDAGDARAYKYGPTWDTDVFDGLMQLINIINLCPGDLIEPETIPIHKCHLCGNQMKLYDGRNGAYYHCEGCHASCNADVIGDAGSLKDLIEQLLGY